MKWKVYKTPIELFPHPDAERLELGKVGDYQVVVEKGLYRSGDIVVFAPEKSVLSGEIKKEFQKYLRGPNGDRVGAARMRGELSCGIIIPPHLLPDLSAFENGDDVSRAIGISRYVADIPEELLGEVREISGSSCFMKHEVYHLNLYIPEIPPQDRVVVTEKVNGTQVSCVLTPEEFFITSKGLAAEGLCFEDDVENLYSLAVRSANVRERLESIDTSKYPGTLECVQAVGEVVPCNKGFGYGFTKDKPAMFVFRLVVITTKGRYEIPYDSVDNVFRDRWVPVLYDGPLSGYDPTVKDGKEQVSGKELHIKEGAVVQTYDMRRSSDGRVIIVKHINKKYAETGEELS